MTQKDIVTILAVIGALVVLGFVLRVTVALIGPLILIALAYFAWRWWQQNQGGGS